MTHNPLHGSEDRERIDEEAALWFTRMHSQRISEQEAEQFKQWLTASSEHAKAYEAIAEVWRDFDALPRPASALKEDSEKRPFFRLWRPLGNTLAAFFIAAILFLPYSHLPSMLLNNMTLVATDFPKEVTLPDGSQLFLNRNTRIHVAYETPVRNVYLESGNAYFKVKSNPYRPFIIQADKRRIQVVGTEFEVNKVAQQVSVNVSQGIVSFQSLENDHPVFLLAGDSAVSQSPNSQITRQHIDALDVARWRFGELVFVDKPLSEVLNELKSYSSLNVELSPISLANSKISGRLNLRQPDAFFQALPSLLPVQVVYQDKNNVLIIQNKKNK
ncbi:FecR domain-containing protein [Providencia rettgeri]|uniref:FecR family protein n=1 Tax=Providencia rettgeri TaxID=587 RepID=UPI0034E0B179